MIRWATAMRSAVRPMMMILLAIIIGPLALVTGLLEVIIPGAGIRFANGFLEYMRGLPESFWMFAGSSYGIYTAARSFGYDKRKEVDLDGSARVDNPDGES